MTVKQTSIDPYFGTNSYIGLSTDTKPTDCSDGSTFYAVDTKASFIFLTGVWYSV